MILVTQFREEVKYCKDEKQQCFAKRLKEGCGESAKFKELRQSKAGPACTNQQGKAIGNVFLIATFDSDECAVVGVENGEIEEAFDVIKDWVQADFEINLPGSEAAGASDADKWVNATSCSAFGSTPPSFGFKIFIVMGQLFVLVAKPVWKRLNFWEEGCKGMSCPKICILVALIVFVLHPVWILIFITPGCDQYRIVNGYELGLTIVKFIYSLLQLGLLTCCSTWQEEDSKPKFGNFAIGSTFYQLVQIGSDCWTISEILKLKSGIFCYDLPYRVQIATIVLSCLSFLVQLAHMIIVWCCLRDSSGVSPSGGRIELSLGHTSYSTGGQPIALFCDDD